jgi:hypothetical protein
MTVSLCGEEGEQKVLGPILNRMDERIFCVVKQEDGRFMVGENCDGYYYVLLTADELRQLGNELIEGSKL